jgi:hypothetical protein
VQAVVKHGSVVSLDSIEGVQARQVPSVAVAPPLAVSIARALAAVCAVQRITVFDLNEDEDAVDDDDDDEDTENLQIDDAEANPDRNSSQPAMSTGGEIDTDGGQDDADDLMGDLEHDA